MVGYFSDDSLISVASICFAGNREGSDASLIRVCKLGVFYLIHDARDAVTANWL